MSRAGWSERLRVAPQYLLPRRFLTACAHRVSNSRLLARPLVAGFRAIFKVDLDEAKPPETGGYRCFNEFFTRALKEGARPLPENDAPVSPSDGTVSQFGNFSDGRLIQAKGIEYSVAALLGSEELARPFTNGRFLTIYLAPGDYHRVHMPVSGRLLTEMRLPGTLFSVSDATSRVIPSLFARNERMAALFETRYGPFAVVMVAALLVAGIETVWRPGGPYRPGREPRQLDPGASVVLERGDEMGRFHWGSTVVLLARPEFPPWSESLVPGQRIRMGRPITMTPDG